MRPTITRLPAQIREVANAGLGRSDVLAFWFGESDEVTPEPIREAAARFAAAPARPSTRTTSACPNCARRIARLRQRRCTAPVDVDRIAVTSSGVNALMLAMQVLVDAGDEVVAVVPVWPNLTGAAGDPGRAGHARAAAPDARAPGGSTWTRCSPR